MISYVFYILQAPKIVFEDIEPFPMESAFVAQYRANIPPPRPSTVTADVLRGQARDRSGRRTAARAAANAVNRRGANQRRERGSTSNTPGTSNSAAAGTSGGGGFQFLLFGERGGRAGRRGGRGGGRGGRRGGRGGRRGGRGRSMAEEEEEEINNTQSAPQD